MNRKLNEQKKTYIFIAKKTINTTKCKCEQTCMEPPIEVVLKSPITSLFKYDFRSKKLEFDDDESIDANEFHWSAAEEWIDGKADGVQNDKGRYDGLTFRFTGIVYSECWSICFWFNWKWKRLTTMAATVKVFDAMWISFANDCPSQIAMQSVNLSIEHQRTRSRLVKRFKWKCRFFSACVIARYVSWDLFLCLLKCTFHTNTHFDASFFTHRYFGIVTWITANGWSLIKLHQSRTQNENHQVHTLMTLFVRRSFRWVLFFFCVCLSRGIFLIFTWYLFHTRFIHLHEIKVKLQVKVDITFIIFFFASTNFSFWFQVFPSFHWRILKFDYDFCCCCRLSFHNFTHLPHLWHAVELHVN